MARNAEPKLGWFADTARAAGGRWTKIYRGKRFTFSDILGKSDREGYQRAVSAYKVWAAKLDLGTDDQKPNLQSYQFAIETRQQMLQWFALADPTNSAVATIRDEITKLSALLAQRVPPAIPAPIAVNPLVKGNMGIDSNGQIIDWLNRLDLIQQINSNAAKTVKAATVEEKYAEYIAARRKDVATGELKPGSLQPIMARTKHFIAHCGGMDASKIDGNILKGYHSKLKDMIVAGDRNNGGASSLLVAAKDFIKWLYADNVLAELPRNMKTLRIDAAPSKVITFTAAELSAIWAHGTDRTKLYALLGLNCAMLSSDIANIRKTEFDPVARTITRKRTKTGDCENVPTVTYQLWDETARLLIQEMDTNPDFEFCLSHNEAQIWYPTETTEGVFSSYSHVENSWVKLRRDVKKHAGIELKAHMYLRKTGPTMLESSTEYSRYSQAFLGHAPSGHTDKYATADNVVIFGAACRWLGQQFGFPTA